MDTNSNFYLDMEVDGRAEPYFTGRKVQDVNPTTICLATYFENYMDSLKNYHIFSYGSLSSANSLTKNALR